MSITSKNEKTFISDFQRSQEPRCRTASESTRERSKRINRDIAKASELRIMKEIKRKKILIEEATISKPRPPSFYINKAREKYEIKAASTNTSFCSEEKTRIFGPLLSTQLIRKREKDLETRHKIQVGKEEKNFGNNALPDWLVERADYQAVAKKMMNLDLNISEICGMAMASRTDEEKKSLVAWVSSVKFFEKLASRIVKDTCDKLTRQIFDINEIIMRKGDIGDCMYIIFSGKGEVFLDEGASHGFLGSKQVIGEHALDTLKPRTATIVAVEKVVVFKLTKVDYDTILLNVKKLEKLKNSKMLMTIPYFKYWSYLKVQHLSNFLIKKNYLPGSVIFDKGDESDTFYILKKGKVEMQAHVDMQQSNRWPTGGKKWKVTELNRKYIVTICNLDKGSFFGETTLIDQLPRVYRAVSLTNSVCLTINKDEFFDIFSVKDLELLVEHSFVHVPKEIDLQQKLVKEIKDRACSVRFT